MSARGCLTERELSALVLGELEDGQVRAIRDHGIGCARCQRAIESAREMDRMMTTTNTPGDAAAEQRLRRRLGESIATFGTVRAPWGDLWVAATDRGITRIEFRSSDDQMAALLERDGLIPERATIELEALHRELDEYFSGRRTVFEIPLDLRVANPFRRAVLERTAAIPAGGFSTYSRIAVDVGRPRAYRAVGNAVGANPIPVVIPCHRVLATGGGLGGYGGGLDIKRYLLELEGVVLPVSRTS
ncbi:MAG: methylated-DNA--[protein]-cysteine S-methyltransferase [Dehalococcoidia bacterium]|nr:methylated-DNA--[protein]-cysteine S-methyltransferase [Dehalococcoidia bacterium]